MTVLQDPLADRMSGGVLDTEKETNDVIIYRNNDWKPVLAISIGQSGESRKDPGSGRFSWQYCFRTWAISHWG
jgi:hypothetical protein